MIHVRKACERGHFHHGRLETRHTFSFGSYYDPQQTGFRALRVMNEDVIAPGQGFGTHPHRDMEIVTYVLDGALEHRDSMGNGEVLRPGEFQRMTAGTGITHSEFNPSPTEPVHLYQIWLLPDRPGHTPSYEQRRFDEAGRCNRLQLVASPDGDGDGDDGALHIHQDARVYLATLEAGRRLVHPLRPGRYAWLQMLRGSGLLNDVELHAGDAAAAEQETELSLSSTTGCEWMVFDLA